MSSTPKDRVFLTVIVKDAPQNWEGEGQISLFWQSNVRPPSHLRGSHNTWELEIAMKDGKWSGSSVGRNSDGRRFLYFAWCNQFGKMFRRIKLYQDQVTGQVVTLNGKMKDDSPACSTAIILPNDSFGA